MSINDNILDITGGPQANDGLAAYFGKTATESLQDAERRWLISKGVSPSSIPDMWYVYLRGLGHYGSLNDMLSQYWASPSEVTYAFHMVTENENHLITVGGNRMGVDTLSSPLVNEPSFRIARNVVIAVIQSVTYDIQTVVSQTSGPASLPVNFDVYLNSSFAGVATPLQHLICWIDYGDGGAEHINIASDHPFGTSAEYSKGFSGGHMYPEGTYTPKVMVYNHVTGEIGYEILATITSLNADTFYPNAETVCLDTSGVFTGAPSGSNNKTTWADFRTAMAVTGNRRGLVRYGEDTVVTESIDHRRDGIYRYGAFGNPVNGLPRLRQDYTTTLGSLGTIYVRTYGNMSVEEWFFDGDYNPETGVGENYTGVAVNVASGDNVAMYRCKVRGLNIGFKIGSIPTTGNYVIQDNDMSDWYDMGIFGHTYNTAIRGNSILQNSLAVNGGGGKKGTVPDLGGSVSSLATVNVLPNCVVNGDATLNLRVFDVDAAGVMTRLFETTDWSFAAGADAIYSGATVTTPSTHQLTEVVGRAAGHTLEYYHARWADHGPIRTDDAHPLLIEHNDLFSNTGWFIEESIQPTIRYNSNGDIGHRGHINANRCEGGNVVIHMGPSDDANDSYLGDVICEDNYVKADGATWRFISIQYGNATVRNNVLYRADIPYTDGRVKLGGAFDTGVGPLSSAANTAAPVRIYNNTIMNEHSVGNGAVDMAVVVQNATSTTPMTDVIEDNNLIYAPSLPTPDTTNTPIDLANYGALLAGNPAIDSGTNLQQDVPDDFFGGARGVTNSIGAGDAVQPVAPAPILSGTFDIPDGTAGDAVNQDVSALRTGGGVATGWAFTGTPPTGLSISSVGVITGTLVEETLAGNSYGVTASNGGGTSNTLLDADGITVSGTSQELTLDGVDKYMSFTSKTLAIGDTVTITVSATGNTTYSSILGSTLLFRYYTANRLRYANLLASATLDGNPVSTGSTNSEVSDGAEHTYVFTCISPFTISTAGSSNGSGEFFDGILKNLVFDIAAEGITAYNIDSGSTTTQAADIGSGTMTFNNIDSGDWT